MMELHLISCKYSCLGAEPKTILIGRIIKVWQASYANCLVKRFNPRSHFTEFIGTTRLKFAPERNFISVKATNTNADHG